MKVHLARTCTVDVLETSETVNPGRMLRPKSGRWMTFKISVEMKNVPIGSRIGLFGAKYLGDRSRPIQGYPKGKMVASFFIGVE